MTSAPTSFAAAARRLLSARTSARERRRFYRAPVVLGGRMLDPLGREHDCRTADISPGDARIAAPLVLDVGQRVVLYLEGLGRVSGVVARRCGENEFAIIFDGSTHKREKLAETLMWLMNKVRLDGDEPPRRAATSPHTARLETEDGRLIEGEILDFSLTGVTVRCAKAPPPLGAWVRVGAVHGRVARWVEGGFAIDFEPRPVRGN